MLRDDEVPGLVPEVLNKRQRFEEPKAKGSSGYQENEEKVKMALATSRMDPDNFPDEETGTHLLISSMKVNKSLLQAEY